MRFFTSPYFRQLDSWVELFNTFQAYKRGTLLPDIFGRDARLSYPHVYHIHLAQDADTRKRWSKITEVHYRTNSIHEEHNDYWLLYAYDNVEESYLLLTVVGPEAHSHKKWRSYLNHIHINIVEPWINGKLDGVK